jgi:hypothetical protein
MYICGGLLLSKPPLIMNKIFVCLFLIFSFQAKSQNLVLNPSFEDTISCTGTYAMQCKYWYWATYGSPDYFSEQPDIFCGTSYVPQSGAGYQYARTGIAYVGLGVYTKHVSPNHINRREYVGGELSDTLKQGHEYCVSFYVSVAEELKYVVDGIGLYLSVDSAVDYTINTNLSFVPQISNPAGNIIYDTLNWVQISGTYIANGGEKYLTIGNFKDDANTAIDSTSASLIESYFFIDDVSVIDCTVGINEVNGNLSSGKLYPNPANTVVYYENELAADESGKIKLMDMLGKEIKEYNLTKGSNFVSIPVSDLAKGIYLVKIKIAGRSDKMIKLAVK